MSCRKATEDLAVYQEARASRSFLMSSLVTVFTFLVCTPVFLHTGTIALYAEEVESPIF